MKPPLGLKATVAVWTIVAVSLQTGAILLAALGGGAEMALAIAAGAFALLAQAVVGILLHAAGVDTEAIRAIARARIKNVGRLRANVRVTRLGAAHASSWTTELKALGMQDEGDGRMSYLGYVGRYKIVPDSDDNLTDLELQFETNPQPLRVLDETLASFQDAVIGLADRLRDAQTNPHVLEFAIIDVPLMHWESPIDDVALLPSGATWSRQLANHERKRLRQYLVANVRLT